MCTKIVQTAARLKAEWFLEARELMMLREGSAEWIQ